MRERGGDGWVLDDARLQVRSAEAQVAAVEGVASVDRDLDRMVHVALQFGVVLEKLVDPGELVSPQTFGDAGPSTSLIAVCGS